MEKQEKKREPILMPRLNAVLDYIEKLDFASRQAKERFKDLDSFCLFVGYPRSGHSLVGSLLDAHPEVVMAHELNALRCVKAGFSQNMIFELILRNVQLFNKKGREWTGYNYKVEGQWQGRYRKLKVIGDKKGGNTSLMLKNKAFQTAVERIFKVPVKYLHVIRNPYDNITTMAANSGGDLDFAINRYAELANIVVEVKERGDPARILDIRHEDMISGPAAQLQRICGFLGVEPEPDWLAACVAIVQPVANKTRFTNQNWTSERIEKVASLIAGIEFLKDYDFNS